MKHANIAQGECTKSELSADETLDAPIRLTPDQLELVAGGYPRLVGQFQGLGRFATTGFIQATPKLTVNSGKSF
jgi:hypothetical protein